VRELAAAAGSPVMVGIDGGVTMANAADVAGWGADVIVSGSAIYDGTDPVGNLARMLERLGRTPAPAPVIPAPV
jgi:ribulose-phosphate 3-epimerase